MGDLIHEFDKPAVYWEKIKFVVILVCRFLQKGLEWLPIRKNRICMISLTHRGYGDNLKYISEYLRQKGKYEIAWITRYPETCSEIKGVKVIKAKTFEHLSWQFTSNVLFSDDYLYMALIKRKMQTYINTWHGGINYKKVGYEGLLFETQFQEKHFAIQNEKPDYMVAGSKFFETNMKMAFRLEHTAFLRTGLPRNDILYLGDKHLENNVRKKLGLEGKKILIYAPTFRNTGFEDNLFGFDCGRVLKTLEARHGGEWVMLYRAHYFVDSTYQFQRSDVMNVSGYNDMQELLLISDYMISDYSSCMWDFLLKRRPCIVYAPDCDQYCQNDRGLTAAGKAMPFPVTTNMDELIETITKYDEDTEYRKNEQHLQEMGSYDKGAARNELGSLVERLCTQGEKME